MASRYQMQLRITTGQQAALVSNRRSFVCKCSSSQSTTSSSAIDYRSLYTRQTYVAPTYVGPVAVVLIQGKGLGWRATRDIYTGELLTVSEPLAVTFGTSGQVPENKSLADVLCGSDLSARDIQLVQLLSGSEARCDASSTSANDGSPSATHAMDLLQPYTPDETQPECSSTSTGQVAHIADDAHGVNITGAHSMPTLPEATDAMSAGSMSNKEGGQAADPLGLYITRLQLDPETCMDVVAGHSYGEASEDVAACELREESPESFLGLWPHLALMNHSCAPNTSITVLGRCLVVHAAAPILEGEEVTVSYLGSYRFSDVATRRSLLKTQYNFHCQCHRCLVEHRLFPTRRYSATDVAELQLSAQALSATSPDAPPAHQGPLQSLLDRVFGAGSFSTAAAQDNTLLKSINESLVELEAGAQDALTALTRVQEQRTSLLARISSAVQQVEEQISPLGLSARDANLMRASVGGLYRLHAEYSELSGLCHPDQHLAALNSWLQVVEAVARGSDTHLFLAVKHRERVQAAHGPASVEGRRAELACAAAHTARYGKGVDADLLKGLMGVRQRMALGSSMAARISLLAWGSGGGAVQVDDVSMRAQEQ